MVLRQRATVIGNDKDGATPPECLTLIWLAAEGPRGAALNERGSGWSERRGEVSYDERRPIQATTVSGEASNALGEQPSGPQPYARAGAKRLRPGEGEQ